MTAPRNTRSTVKVTAERADQETKARTARQKAADDAKRTAQSTSEAARETVKEVTEDTKSFMQTVGTRAQYLAVRTTQEVDRARKAVRPFVRPILYTAGAVIEPVGTLGVAAVDFGTHVIRNRVRELAAEDQQVSLSTVEPEHAPQQ